MAGKNKDNVRAYNKRYYAEHDGAARVRAYRAANPDKVKATNRLRYATPEVAKKTAASTKRWALANPERYAKIANLAQIRFRLRKHGLTIEQYEAMLADQGYCCAACGSKSTGVKRNGKHGAKPRLEEGWPTTAQQGDFTWSIDHCHRTGKVRGLLCARCNTALGMVDDKPEILVALIEYLKLTKES